MNKNVYLPTYPPTHKRRYGYRHKYISFHAVTVLLLWQFPLSKPHGISQFLIGDGIWSLILLFTKLSWNPIFHSCRSYIKTLPFFTETSSNSPQIQTERNWSQRIDPKDKCARSSPDFLKSFIFQRDDLESQKLAQHQSEVMTLRSLTLLIICCLLQWGEGTVSFGFEMEYIFLSDAGKTLIRAWNSHKKECWNQIWPSGKLYVYLKKISQTLECIWQYFHKK